MPSIPTADIANRLDNFAALAISKSEHIATITKALQASLKSKNYYEAFLAINCLDDAHHGIRSSIADGLYLRVTQANFRNPKHVHDSRFHYIAMGIALIMTAEKLLKIKDKFDENVALRLHQALIRFIQQNLVDTDPMLASIRLGQLHENFVVPLIMQLTGTLSVETVSDQIKATRHFINLDHAPLIMANRFYVDGHAYDHIDIPVTKLTETQRAWYQNVEAQPFYQKQSPLMKKLIKDASPKILNGHMIPTQMKGVLPGIRNAGLDIIFSAGHGVIESREILRACHSGSLGHTMKSVDNQVYTDENFHQLASNLNAQHIHIANLLSPIGEFDDDKILTAQINHSKAVYQRSTSETQFHFSLLPINFLRYTYLSHLTGNRKNDSAFSGAYSLLALAKDVLRNATQTDSLIYLKLQRAATELENQLQQWAVLDIMNINLQLAVKCRIIASCISAVSHTKVIQADACKSGKEREGMTRIFSFAQSIQDDLLLKHQKKTRINEILVSLRDARILQKLNAMHGGTFGSDGLKGSSRHALPLPQQITCAPLFQETASINKIYPKARLSSAEVGLYLLALIAALPLCIIGVGFYFVYQIVHRLNIQFTTESDIYRDILQSNEVDKHHSIRRINRHILPVNTAVVGQRFFSNNHNTMEIHPTKPSMSPNFFGET